MIDELIEDIKVMAALAYTPEQIAIALGLSQDDVCNYMLDPESSFYQAYYAAYFANDIKLRNSINKLAISGSSPAQAVMLKIYSQNEIKKSI